MLTGRTRLFSLVIGPTQPEDSIKGEREEKEKRKIIIATYGKEDSDESPVAKDAQKS